MISTRRPVLVRSAATAAAAVVVTASMIAGASGGTRSTAATPDSVNIAFNVKITTLDPDQVYAQPDLNALHLIGGNLFEEVRDGKIVPGLASKWRVSKDKLSWTFTLRPNLKFSDGTPLTAADVQATMARALGDKANINAAILQRLRNVVAVDPRTVRFNLKSPYPNIRALLTQEGTMVLPKTRLNGKTFYQHPISAGPYQLQSWGGGSEAVFTRNPKYWGKKPAIRELRFVALSDPGTSVTQLRTRQVDMVFDLPPSYLATLSGDKAIQAEVVKAYGWYTLNMWNKDRLLKDPNLRKAVSAAIDRQRLVQLIWQGKNDALAGFWPNTMVGHDPKISTARNLARAKKLIASSSCAKGCTLSLMFSPAVLTWSEQAATLIRDNLKDIGVKVNLVRVDPTTFVTNLGGKYQLALYGLLDFVNIPDGLMPYGLSAIGGVVNSNFSSYRSPATEKLVAKVLRTSGNAQRKLLFDVNQRFLADQPFATLATWTWIPASRIPKSLLSVEHSGLLDVARQ